MKDTAVDSRTAAAILGGLLMLIHAGWMVALFGGLAVDDAYITFRYAENLAAGAGPVFNPGVAVEGYSNFLWMILLSPLTWLVDDLTGPAILGGLLCSVVTVLLIPRLLDRLLGVQRIESVILAIATVVCSGYVAGWAGGGLEGPLYGLLLLLAWAGVVEAERGARWPGLALLAVALCRPEGVFIALGGAAVITVRAVRAGRPRPWVTLAVVLGGLLVYHGWRFSFYGPYPFPNSVRAKVGGTTAQVMRGLGYVSRQFWTGAPLLLSLLLLRRPTHRLAAWTGVPLLVGYVLFIALVGGDWAEGRLLAPIVPLGAVLLAAAVADLDRRWLLLLAVPWLAVMFWHTSIHKEAAFRSAFVDKDRERVAIGRWLAAATPPRTTVAVFAAGQIPYYSRRPTHDMLGLNDARIAAVEVSDFGAGSAGHEKYDLDYTIREVRPEVIVDGHLIPGLIDDADVQRDYARLVMWTHNVVLVRRDAAWLR